VAPIPIRPLLLVSRISNGPMLTMSLAEVLTIGTIFVAIPIAVVLVGTVIDPVVPLIVSNVRPLK
jgi:hypothetical protein